MIGLVYYLPSPRHVGVAKMYEILNTVEPFQQSGRKTVLVVVDQLPDASIVSRFDFVQAYGIKPFGIPAVRQICVVKDNSTFFDAVEFPLYTLEITEGKLPGGNGIPWDWSVAKTFCERYPTLIAGGITTENVADVIRQAHPFGIDVSSGVESSPGVKDMDKVKRLIENARL